ncbi:molybdopterin-guanine dinucleotide biosynthesis protein B [Halorubrum trapanicum]|uniref:Molybdopterin-guanine dinucleotide biosynthesis protein B n=1 Tax=Halorubrum trapanicum TaxID=29284 RepID=A0A8J7R6Y4_9EURY|nr:molybdopterin-guanine dinucleotide biosynthesis protein MobB [Halorubrum trapanicum]MBP1901566.1 molybdopterin-guanine dinucleotide biosynthesis protein B [Halorubrum trapanicum]
MNPTARDRTATEDGAPADDSRAAADRSPDADPLPVVVGVAGPSGAGKTTLVERLVDTFAAEGERVATVKSIHHAIEPDEPGTDTHRHRTAGAAATVGITPQHAFEVSPHDPDGTGPDGDVGDVDFDEEDGSEEDDGSEEIGGADARKRAALREAIDRFAAAGHDLVVVEGFAEVPIPTVLAGDADLETVAGEIVAEGDDPFNTVREAVRDVDPPESLGQPDAAEPNATDTHDK